MELCNEIKEILINNLDDILKLKKKKLLKSDNSYVSAGDLLCESLVKKHLTNFYPGYYLVSEETPELNLVNILKNKVVILDPIDGTENFISGLKEWGISVSCYENGIHQQSMIGIPQLDSYIITGNHVERYNSRIAGISSSLTKNDLMKLESGFEYRIMGCCVYNMYNVIVGSYFSFENPRGAWIWDIQAGLNLALEHGLEVKVNNNTYYGELLRPDQKYIFKIRQK